MTIKIGVLNLSNRSGDMVHLTDHNKRGRGHEVDLKRGEMHEIWLTGQGAVSLTAEGCHTQGDGVDEFMGEPKVNVDERHELKRN